MNGFTVRPWLALVTAAAFNGCAATAVVSESANLADAGIAYGQAAQDILPLTRERYLDWQSDSLLEERLGLDPCTEEQVDANEQPEDCQALIKKFDGAQETQKTLAQNFTDLADHARALQSYFQSLKTLTDYDSATSAANAAGRAIDRINGLSNSLEGAANIKPEQREAWAGLMGLIGDAVKAAKLRARLQADAATIGRALDIQDGVLETCAGLLGGLDAAAREEEFQADVRTPYVTNSISDGRSWKAARVASLTPTPEIEELKHLKSASAQLRDVWEDILSGSGSPAAAQRVFEDLSRAIDVLNAVRRAEAKPQ
jgi:hypothetical protein